MSARKPTVTIIKPKPEPEISVRKSETVIVKVPGYQFMLSPAQAKVLLGKLYRALKS